MFTFFLSLSLQFPDAWLLLANVMVLLILIPLKDRVIDPFLAKKKLLPSALRRMALGMIFGLGSVLLAGKHFVHKLVLTPHSLPLKQGRLKYSNKKHQP